MLVHQFKECISSTNSLSLSPLLHTNRTIALLGPEAKNVPFLDINNIEASYTTRYIVEKKEKGFKRRGQAELVLHQIQNGPLYLIVINQNTIAEDQENLNRALKK